MKVLKYKLFLESLKEDMWDIIPKSVKDLQLLFKNNNKKLYVVGGAVRDFINNEQPKDFDLCTDATPDEILKIVSKYKTNIQGKAFGVIVVYTDDQPMGIEIATFREDIYNDKLGISRDPDIKFSTIEKDVLRRDIPFNAMFYDLDKKEIIDIVGGMEDMQNKISRFVGDPNQRITEDPIRILRLFRFSCRYNYEIEENTVISIKINKDKLSIISKERIWDEFCKSWKQIKNFNKYLELLTEFNMWTQIFPGSNINTKPTNSDNFIIIIANLFKNENINGLVERMVQEYKIKNDTSVLIVFLISLLNFNPEDVLQYYRKKEQIIDAYIKGVESERVKYKKRLNELITEWFGVNNIHDRLLFKFLDYTPTVSSQDLMNQGFHGHRLGVELRRLETENFLKM